MAASASSPLKKQKIVTFMDAYKEQVAASIKHILSRSESETLTYDILDTARSIRNKLTAHKERQRQMKVGEIWQDVLGTWEGCINLKIGHETGLDILSHERKFAIELKNRTNTDNSSARKANLDKLARFKKANPDYTCVYGNINADTEAKTMANKSKIIVHEGVEIQHLVGMTLLKFILGDSAEEVISFVKETIDETLENL
jgi:hypothetical protein